ncbi:MAG: pilus assembly protein PilM [Candidatus Omnitrophota bacterium]
MPDKDIKKKIFSVLQNASSAGKSKPPKLKKSIVSIFSKKSDEDQIKKIAPLFQTTPPGEPAVSDKLSPKKISIDKLKIYYPVIKKKIVAWSKRLINNLGITEELTGLWGLDIGSTYLKLLKISREDGKPTITNFYCEQIPPKFRGEGPQRDEFLKQFLRKLILKYKIEGDFVNYSIANPDLIIRSFKLPKMSYQEISKAVQWRLTQQYSVELSKQIMRYIVLGEKEDRGVKQLEILTTTVPKEIIKEYVSFLRQSGLKPVAIEPDSFSFAFCVLANYKWKPNEVIVALNIGAKNTLFNVIINGNVNFCRKISSGGHSFLSALAKNMNISPEEAREKLNAFGVPKIDWQGFGSQGEESNYTDEQLIFKAIQSPLEKFITEFRNSFDFFSYYLTHSSIQTIDKILISGGGSKIKNLNEFLSARLEAPVEKLNSLQNLQIAEQIDKKSLEQWSSQLDIAIGLALKRKF